MPETQTMRKVIDREKLLDALGEAADQALELARVRPELTTYHHGVSDALTLVFDLVAKFPVEEVE